ncbi:MAG: PQQ-binding-like beta-propeller repeat protein [Bryobacteraceae bacterium]
MTRGLARSLFLLLPVFAGDWSQFRGPNAAGVSDATGLPVEFGPEKNVAWKTALPPGHSSPVLTSDTIFLTALEGEKLLTLAVDRGTGRIKWRREAPRARKQEQHKANMATSPSPVTDGASVYSFFTDFGLISYGRDGAERWRLPLGPFNNPFGMGASPILAGDSLIMSCDSESGGFLLAVNKDTGTVRWRVERPDFTRGFSTPVLYQPPKGPQQVILAGSFELAAYEVETGRKAWWTSGMTWQMKPTPVLGRDVIYVQGWAGGADNGQQEVVPTFEEVLKSKDADRDGRLSKAEIADPRLISDWRAMDLDDDGVVNARDWKMYQGRRSVVNALSAFRLGGTGDVSDSAALWKYYKSLPNVPSPLLYQDVLYMLKEGGILTTLDPKTGAVYKQARLTGALDQYFSSTVAADGKIYAISQAGKASVIKAGPEWEILALNDLGDECHATPAIADGKLYVRTRGTLYCFARRE